MTGAPAEKADFVHEIKEFIIRTLSLEDITPQEIEDHAPLFGDGLGLDSVDALEIGVALQEQYGVQMNAESVDARKHFACAASLAAFVMENGKR